jgi:heat-inducible transcriptional repressor
MAAELDDRSFKILHQLVEFYIQEGQPVGSKALMQRSQLALSPASIRHIMADLEAAGLLQSPHTSAGRVPTAEGYRLFANHLLTAQSPHGVDVEEFRQRFESQLDETALIEQTSSILSTMTQLAGLVTLPKRDQLILKQVEFLPLSEKRVLAILIFNEEEVQNRVIETQQAFSRRRLEEAGNDLTALFSGEDFYQIREKIIHEMKVQRKDLEDMLKVVVDMAEEAQEKEQTHDYVLTGEANLFDAVGNDDYPRLQSLFQAFSKKRDILHLLDRSLAASGIQIFIGKESGHDLLADYSLVTAPYSVNNHVVGVLGVIGPTRMAYHQAISAVDITSKLLSQALLN